MTSILTGTTAASGNALTLNVLDYGAAGNGVTDDTAAIQQALDTGASVYLPDGNYLISSTLLMDTSYQTLSGNGKLSKIRSAITDGTAAIRVNGAAQVTLRDFLVTEENDTSIKNFIGVEFNNSISWYMENVYSRYAATGFKFTASFIGTAVNAWAKYCTLGMSASEWNAVNFDGKFENVAQAFDIDEAFGCTMNLLIEGEPRTTPAALDNAQSFNIENLYMENAGGEASSVAELNIGHTTACYNCEVNTRVAFNTSVVSPIISVDYADGLRISGNILHSAYRDYVRTTANTKNLTLNVIDSSTSAKQITAPANTSLLTPVNFYPDPYYHSAIPVISASSNASASEETTTVLPWTDKALRITGTEGTSYNYSRQRLSFSEHPHLVSLRGKTIGFASWIYVPNNDFYTMNTTNVFVRVVSDGSPSADSASGSGSADGRLWVKGQWALVVVEAAIPTDATYIDIRYYINNSATLATANTYCIFGGGLLWIGGRALTQKVQNGLLSHHPRAHDPARVFNVRDYGAVGDGITDDTAAIQATINAAIASLSGTVLGAEVRIPKGAYKVTSTLTSNSGIQIRGDAKRGSVLLFVPTADDTCLLIDGADQDNNNVVSNLEIRSTTQFDKTGIHIVDTSACIVDNCYIRFSDTSGNYDDVGIKVSGRQSLTVRDVTIFAPVPIYIIDDGSGTINDIDNANFENLYLVSEPAPDTLTRACVLIDGATTASHVTFSGRQAWAKGDYGIHYATNVSSATAPALRLENIRWEQPTSTAGYGYYFGATSGAPFFELRNCRSSADAGGLYLRNCRCTASNCRFGRDTGDTGDSINADDCTLVLDNCEITSTGSLTFGSGCKCTLKTTSGLSENTISGNFPVSGRYVWPTASETAPSFGMLEGVSRYGGKFLIADDYKHAIPLIQANGVICGIMHVFAFDASKTVVAAGVFAIWDGDLDGGSKGVKLLSGTTSMGTTANNDGTFNVYTGAASLGSLYLQNKLGAAVTAVVTADFVSTDQELGNDFAHNAATT